MFLLACGGEEESETTEAETEEASDETTEDATEDVVAVDISDAVMGADFVRGAGLGSAQASIRDGETGLVLDYESETMDVFAGDIEGYESEITYEYDEDGNARGIQCSVMIEDADALMSTYESVAANYTEKLGERTDGDHEFSMWETDGRIIEVHGYDGELYITLDVE